MEPRNELPFNISSSEAGPDTGKENLIENLTVIDSQGEERKATLKENRLLELAGDEQMKEMKSLYDFMKNDEKFGKFVVETGFLKARRNEGEAPHSYLVQKTIDGKRIDTMSEEELYGDKALAAELLEFVEAAIGMFEKANADHRYLPDFYADQKKFFGNFLHNPRYSGNIMIANKNSESSQRVYFVDTGTVFGPGREPGLRKKLTEPIDQKLQLFQLERWAKKLREILQ